MRLFATDDQLLQVDPNYCLTQATSLRASPHVISNSLHDRPSSHQTEHRTTTGPVTNGNAHQPEYHMATGVANVAHNTNQSEYHSEEAREGSKRRQGSELACGGEGKGKDWTRT